MKTRTIILIFIGLALVLTGIASLPLLMHRAIRSRIGPQHVFTLSEQPASLTLTEELAIAKARETLSLDGMNSDLWLLATNGCTISSNRAVVVFLRMVRRPRVSCMSNWTAAEWFVRLRPESESYEFGVDPRAWSGRDRLGSISGSSYWDCPPAELEDLLERA